MCYWEAAALVPNYRDTVRRKLKESARAGLETILGFCVQANRLTVDPCLPKSWHGYEIVFRRRGARDVITRYEIAVENPDRTSAASRAHRARTTVWQEPRRAF